LTLNLERMRMRARLGVQDILLIGRPLSGVFRRRRARSMFAIVQVCAGVTGACEQTHPLTFHSDHAV
jgi:hypothetical protein